MNNFQSLKSAAATPRFAVFLRALSQNLLTALKFFGGEIQVLHRTHAIIFKIETKGETPRPLLLKRFMVYGDEKAE